MPFPGEVVRVLTDSSMSASSTTSQVDVGTFPTLTMTFIWTGTPTGSVSVQVSPDTNTWTDLPGSSQTTGGTEGSHTVNVSGSGHMYARGKYTYSSGTGSLTVRLTGKN